MDGFLKPLGAGEDEDEIDEEAHGRRRAQPKVERHASGLPGERDIKQADDKEADAHRDPDKVLHARTPVRTRPGRPVRRMAIGRNAVKRLRSADRAA